jgi:hypothetical protein
MGKSDDIDVRDANVCPTANGMLTVDPCAVGRVLLKRTMKGRRRLPPTAPGKQVLKVKSGS